MSDPASAYGRSYWEIVVHAFRKNWAARIGLWISILMLVVSILTPLLSNDRPFTFVGTMPGEYQKSFRQVTRGAYLQIRGLPDRLRDTQRKFETRQATYGEFLELLQPSESRAIDGAIQRIGKEAESDLSLKGKWFSKNITVAEMLALLQEEEQAPFLAALRRIQNDLPAQFDGKLAEMREGVRIKLAEMTDQLGPEAVERSRRVEERFEKATAPGYFEAASDRKADLEAAIEELKAGFDPEKVTLVAKRRLPLLDSLEVADWFFVPAVLFGVIVFGPLTWWRLKRVVPLERRWAVSWALILLPALLLSLAWGVFHDRKFLTVSYKKGLEDGSIRAESILWPPHRYRFDEIPETIKEKLLPPSAEHPFGTDFFGRDLLARMLWGSRISLAIGFVSTAIAALIGVVLGVLAGYYRGRVDIVISRVIEWMICFPSFFLILAVVAFLPPNIFYVMIVLGLFGWMGIARLQRGEIYRLGHSDFVQAARALGTRNSRIMFRHLLPNALAPVLVAASFGIASAMLTESALSFLGFGVQDPKTSWGQILFTARTVVASTPEKWWAYTIPGFAIFLAVTCYNLVGDGIRDAVDPRLKT